MQVGRDFPLAQRQCGPGKGGVQLALSRNWMADKKGPFHTMVMGCGAIAVVAGRGYIERLLARSAVCGGFH